MRPHAYLASLPIGLALAVSTQAQAPSRPTVPGITNGPNVTTRMQVVRRLNPTTGRYDLVYRPAPVQTMAPGPVSPVSPYPVNTIPSGPLPYPAYPYVYPNPYPGGNWNNVQPPSGSQVGYRQVASWYSRYLRRQVDTVGLRTHVAAYNQTGPESALAGILGSQEYYRIWGNTPNGFVQGLYQDVLRRPAQPSEIATWSTQVGRKSLNQIAHDFLKAARRELGGPYY